MGAWGMMREVIEEVAEVAGCERPRLRYAGRHSAASPATGSHARHVAEQKALVEDALALGRPIVGRIAQRRDREAARLGPLTEAAQ